MPDVWQQDTQASDQADRTSRQGGLPSVQAQMLASGIELRGAGADEAPEVYKRLPDVLAAHGDTIRILHTLHPIGVAMAGIDECDPYRD